jgi:sorting nexin-8
VLRAEPIVVTFLTVPTDMANWKRQAKIDYLVEFKGKKILTEFINSIWPTVGEEFLEKWKQCESSIGRLIEIWTKLVLLVERNEKRQQQIAFDNGKFVEMLNRFTGLDDALYPHDDGIVGNSNKDDMAAINDSLGTIGEFFNKTSQALVDDSFAINTSTLEKFKNYLDYLYSLQELFERSKKLLTNNIAQLEARITENEAKYARLSTDDADIKGSDLAKLRQAIIADKQEMFQQLNRDWLIKSCCMDEYIMFQETQYLVSEAWVDWCRGRTQHQAKMGLLYDQMSGIIGDMPLNS